MGYFENFIRKTILFPFIVFIFTCNPLTKSKDIPIAIEDPALVYSLEADWKMKIGNYPESKNPEYDDSKWESFPVPGYWRYKGINDVQNMWYRLPLLIGDKWDGREMGILVPGIFEGYELFFNGHKIGEEGEFDKYGNLLSIRHRVKYYPIPNELVLLGSRNLLSLHVLDNHNFGAITGNFYIGTYEKIQTKFLTTIFLSVGITGFLFVIGIALFLVTMGRREFLSFFLFSIVLINSSIVILFLDRVLGWWIEDFQLLNFVFLLGSAVNVVLYILVALLYFDIKPRIIGKSIISLSIPLILIVLIFGYNEEYLSIRNSITLPLIHLYGILVIGYILSVLFRAYRKKNVKGISWIIIGAIVLMVNLLFILFKVNDHLAEKFLPITYLFFFMMVFYAMSLEYLNRLQQEKNREARHRKELEIEVAEKTKNLIETNQELESANQMKNHLFAVIGHDLRSPLDTLKFIMDLFQNQKLTHKEFSSHILEINEMLKQSRQLLENLLNWASSQLGYKKIVNTKIDILELCKNVSKMHLLTAKNKEIQLKIHSDGSPIIESDSKILEMVLHNLINNAIKYSHKNSEVILQITETDSHVEISVIDCGIGIPLEVEDFMDDTRNFLRNGTNQEKSTGIGLLLCKTFLGKIESQLFYAKNEKQGSIFCFYLKKNKNIS